VKLHLLPDRSGGAAENMALDFLLLQRYPDAGSARFRHYDWRRPAFTFGYSQKIGFVRGTLPAGGPFDLCRRPTGGGVVDHRDDWTFSLVIPRGHPLEELPAPQSYRAVHACLVGALRAQGAEAELQATGLPRATAEAAGVCFERAEVHDVLCARTGEKIAGGAQKRNKRGLLFQGSIWRPALAGALASPGAFDWERLHGDFAGRLSEGLGIPAEAVPWPEFNEDEVEGLVEQYSAPEWMEFR
jgi:lipoate-protein ligase A